MVGCSNSEGRPMARHAETSKLKRSQWIRLGLMLMTAVHFMTGPTSARPVTSSTPNEVFLQSTANPNPNPLPRPSQPPTSINPSLSNAQNTFPHRTSTPTITHESSVTTPRDVHADESINPPSMPRSKTDSRISSQRSNPSHSQVPTLAPTNEVDTKTLEHLSNALRILQDPTNTPRNNANSKTSDQRPNPSHEQGPTTTHRDEAAFPLSDLHTSLLHQTQGSILAMENDRTATRRKTTSTRKSALDSMNIKSGTVAPTVASQKETVNFLTLIAVIALVITLFITCLLIAIICPHNMTCYFLQVLMCNSRQVKNTSYDVYQHHPRPCSPPAPPTTPSAPHTPIDRHLEQKQRNIFKNKKEEPASIIIDESLSNEANSSSQTNDVINFCCLALRTRGAARDDDRTIAGLNLAVENHPSTPPPEVNNEIENPIVQKYRKLTRHPSDSTIRGEEQSSSGTERPSSIESDSDNLSRALCPRSRTRLLHFHGYRSSSRSRSRWSSESDVNDTENESIGNGNGGGIAFEAKKQSLSKTPSRNAVNSVDECPYCSGTNLRVNPKGQGQVDEDSKRTADKVKHSAL